MENRYFKRNEIAQKKLEFADELMTGGLSAARHAIKMLNSGEATTEERVSLICALLQAAAILGSPYDDTNSQI